MIRINLVGSERQRKARAVTFGAGQRLTLACSLVLVVAAGLIGWWYWSLSQASAQVDTDIATATQEVLRLQSVLTEVQQAEQRRQQVQQRVGLIQELQRGQNTPVQLLDHISRSLPEMLWLTTMNQKSSEVTIEGRSTTLIGVSDFVGNLGTSPLLKKPIEIVGSQVENVAGTGANAGPGVDLIKFTIKAQLTQTAGPAPAPAAAGRGRGAQ